jgi:hypothetical protein
VELDPQNTPAGRRGLQGLGGGQAAGRTRPPAAQAVSTTGNDRAEQGRPNGGRTCLRGEGVEVCGGGNPALHVQVIAKHLGSVALQAGAAGKQGWKARLREEESVKRMGAGNGGRRRGMGVEPGRHPVTACKLSQPAVKSWSSPQSMP